MSKGVKMMALACCISAGAMAQTTVDTLQTQSDEFDFTFSEAQLDEDNDAAQTVSSIVAAKDDYFLSEVGYRFSPMRYRVRAYDNKYSQTLMNGVVLNDAERGMLDPILDRCADIYKNEIDFEEQPPMFQISDTHYAATWLLHPDAPKVDPPKIITDRIARMKSKREE